MKDKRKVIKNIAKVLLILLIIVGCIFMIYVRDYYRTSDYVNEIVAENETRIEFEGRYTVIHPEEILKEQIGIIFYPGGKVESSAYMPLLIKLSDMGFTCVLVDMPMNLAVFNINAADDVYSMYPDIDSWYLAGHSLGGAMASSYMEKHHDEVEGLILLGAYPVNEAPVNTLAVYGTYDLKLNLEKVLLADEVYEIIDGNHANFGDYGEQEGDGKALVSREVQQTMTVERIEKFILENIN